MKKFTKFVNVLAVSVMIGTSGAVMAHSNPIHVNASAKNSQGHVKLKSDSKGTVVLQKPLRVQDFGSADENYVTIPKGTKLHWSTNNGDVQVWNHKYKQSEDYSADQSQVSKLLKMEKSEKGSGVGTKAIKGNPNDRAARVAKGDGLGSSNKAKANRSKKANQPNKGNAKKNDSNKKATKKVNNNNNKSNRSTPSNTKKNLPQTGDKTVSGGITAGIVAVLSLGLAYLVRPWRKFHSKN